MKEDGTVVIDFAVKFDSGLTNILRKEIGKGVDMPPLSKNQGVVLKMDNSTPEEKELLHVIYGPNGRSITINDCLKRRDTKNKDTSLAQKVRKN